ncbi:MAG: sensor domain-containing diguanylate cyclase [Myxococcaceae bacterium]|nr:sensor domain-containing diguanylate cyclase [Myxococcaceae bacterium]
MNPSELLGAMKRNLEQLAAFNQIAKALTSTLEVGEVLKVVMEEVGKLLQPESWSLLLEGSDGQLYFEICVGPAADRLKGLRVPPGEGIAGSVFRAGKGRLVNDVRDDPDFSSRFDEVTEFKTQSVIAVPLVLRGRSLGVIELVNKKGAEPFDRDDLRAVTAIADYAAIAIENARNVQKVQELTLTDEHTNLFNARFLTVTLEREIERAHRFGRPVSVVFLDVDRFKEVNDTRGHLVGSALLKAIGKTLLESVRSVDSACRYGGDEFAVLLLETHADRAKVVAERIRHAIAAKEHVIDGAPVKITVSVGWATFPEHAKTGRALLQAADQAMYAAKAAGRNAVAGAGAG